MRRAVTLFTSCNGLLLFRRQNSTKAATVKREQSSGNTIWQLHLLVAREYPSPSPHRGPVSRGTGGRARACPHFTCTFWDCWSRLFTYLRLKSLTLQPLYLQETNEVGVGWFRSCFAWWYVQMCLFLFGLFCLYLHEKNAPFSALSVPGVYVLLMLAWYLIARGFPATLSRTLSPYSRIYPRNNSAVMPHLFHFPLESSSS